VHILLVCEQVSSSAIIRSTTLTCCLLRRLQTPPTCFTNTAAISVSRHRWGRPVPLPPHQPCHMPPITIPWLRLQQRLQQ
jgi:hypothetical protein